MVSTSYIFPLFFVFPFTFVSFDTASKIRLSQHAKPLVKSSSFQAVDIYGDAHYFFAFYFLLNKVTFGCYFQPIFILVLDILSELVLILVLETVLKSTHGATKTSNL